MSLLRIFIDRSTEYCGSLQHRKYQLYLALENVHHFTTQARSPRNGGVCERFHRPVQDKFRQVAFCKKLYTSVEQQQAALDEWPLEYNASIRTAASTVTDARCTDFSGHQASGVPRIAPAVDCLGALGFHRPCGDTQWGDTPSALFRIAVCRSRACHS
jgi:hypothetical protein